MTEFESFDVPDDGDAANALNHVSPSLSFVDDESDIYEFDGSWIPVNDDRS